TAVADPEELHLFADEWLDWNYGVEGHLRVIRHALCDLGTALMLYWRGQPGYYLKYADREHVPERERRVFDLLKESEERVQAGYYRQARFAYDPRDDQGHDQTPHPLRLKRFGRDLPTAMYQPVAGETT